MGSLLRRRLCDSCCLTVGAAAALLLSALLPLLAPWHLLLPELEPEHARVVLPRMPRDFRVGVIRAASDGTLPLATISERYTRRNLPVVLRPHEGYRGASGTCTASADDVVAKLLRRRIPLRVQPARARDTDGTQLTAQVFGSPPAQPAVDGEFYPSRTGSWAAFLADSTSLSVEAGGNEQSESETGCACYAARVSILRALPEFQTLLQLPLASEHPLADTVGEPYPDSPTLYASHGRGESTPIHFDEEENWLFVLRGVKMVVLYEPHAATRGQLPRHEVYRTTSPVPPHTPEERTQVEQAFPSLRGGNPLYLNVTAGEALYIPAFWWHGLIAIADGHQGCSTERTDANANGNVGTDSRTAGAAEAADAAAGAAGGGGGANMLEGRDSNGNESSALPGCVADGHAGGSVLLSANCEPLDHVASAAVMSLAYWAEPQTGKFTVR
jgi:hypothetical protein